MPPATDRVVTLAYAVPTVHSAPRRVLVERDTPILMTLIVIIPQGIRATLFLLPSLVVLVEAAQRLSMPSGTGIIVLANLLIPASYMMTLLLRVCRVIRGRSAFDGLAVMDLFLAFVTCMWPFYLRTTGDDARRQSTFAIIVVLYAILSGTIAIGTMQTARHLPRRAGEAE